jgi:hypothetical protein
VATTDQSPPGKGGRILGLDPLMFWGLVGAAGLGAVYFLFHKPAATQQTPAATGTAPGPGLISADGAPVMFPTGSGQAGSGSVVTLPSGGGTGGRRRPVSPPVKSFPKGGAAGSGPQLTALAAQPLGSTAAGSGALLPIGTLPPLAAGAKFPGITSPGFVWPFPTKSPSQFRRIDQGWDLQAAGTAITPVLAVAPGRVTQLGPDPGGFGQAYPGLILDKPRGGISEVYYGHTFLKAGEAGKHVRAGQVIGYTGGPTSGGDAAGLPNWLEIGSFPPGAMGGGSRIRGLLLHAPTAASVRRRRTVQAAPTHRVSLPRGLPRLPPPRRRAGAPARRRLAPGMRRR